MTALAEQPAQDADAGKRLKEKVGVRTYFGSKEQLEKATGGSTHYRIILSFE